MTEVYRFRSISRLLGEPYRELERQTIFFTRPDQLNDPMEEFRDIVWYGDRIVWTNLFRNYVFSLYQTYLLLITVGNEEALRDHYLPIMACWNESQGPQIRELLDDLWKRVSEKLKLHTLVDKVTAMNRKVRSDELTFYFYQLHADIISEIQRIHAERGLAPEAERPKQEGLEIRPTLADSGYFEQLQKAATKQGISPDDVFPSLYRWPEESDWRRYVTCRDSSKIPRSSRTHLLLSFPMKYVEKLEELLWPEWYTACFSKSYHNSSVWGHYGEDHKGVCLIFEAAESDHVRSLELKRLTGRQINEKGENSENWTFSSMSFRDIKYDVKPATIDFFRNIGVLPLPTLMKLWYTDDAGNISECADHFDSEISEMEWHERHWGEFERNITIKSKDREYEQECRLVLNGQLDLSLEDRRRSLKYKFDSLKGLIFGIRTPAEDKFRIMEIIHSKCLESDRTDFKIYQAYFSPRDEKIRKYEI